MNGSPRVLVAGIGNIFLSDDGFGVEVVRRLGEDRVPPWVRVADYGISGLHLAYELLHGYEKTILVDTVSQGGEPGTLYLIEAESGTQTGRPTSTLDAHGMQPDAVLHLARAMGADPGKVLLLGCEPARLDEGIGLTTAIAAAVPKAVELLTRLAREPTGVPLSTPVRTKGTPC
ncbi:MAG TPA: hydrogenase maturation protease [Amycolatopsis sp.]|jgi:hydrogenase maturation protease|nr:hydrogenase maturation protease [Amycolatopsis sp.]